MSIQAALTGQDAAGASAPRVLPETTRAMVADRYGPPSALQLREVALPPLGDTDVLVRVRAAGVNPYDWHMMTGNPYFMRAFVGWSGPKVPVPGVDFAGEVVAVGADVTGLAPGDAVFGRGESAYADHLVAPQSTVLRKPERLSFEQAGGVFVAAATALQGLRDHGGLRSGQRVLINGASGGVGTFAVQIAKALGAEVTGVCSGRNVELVRSLGADHVIDYTREDFTQRGERYDVFFDGVGNRPLLACRGCLTPEGTYVLVGGPKGPVLGPMIRLLRAVMLGLVVRQSFVSFVAEARREDLELLQTLLADGQITPVVDRSWPLAEAPAALDYLQTGRARGKIILTS